MCELGEDHEGDHGKHIPDAVHSELWARWDDSPGRFVLDDLPWCPIDPDQPPCALFAGHPGPHSADIYDPTIRAIEEHERRRLRAHQDDEEQAP